MLGEVEAANRKYDERKTMTTSKQLVDDLLLKMPEFEAQLKSLRGDFEALKQIAQDLDADNAASKGTIKALTGRLAELETNPTRDELLTTAAITRSAADISKLALKKAVALEHWRWELGCSAKEGWSN